MKLFKITGHPYDKGYHYNMTKTGEILTPEFHVNPHEISSLVPWEGDLLNKGKKGTKVIMNNGTSYIDHRSAKYLIELIEQL